MAPAQNPFVRGESLDKPGIVGARWWNEALRDASSLKGRRAVLAVLGTGAALLGGVAICGALASVGSSDSGGEEPREELRASLDMQREYGWNFGATSEGLVYDGATVGTFDRSSLARLVEDLSPARSELRPFYVPTLFQSPEALPQKKLEEEGQVAFAPIAEALKPIFTPKMDESYRIGQSLAALLTQGAAAPVALIIDMVGPQAVALAAGAAEHFDPVFLFDNWPHPRGVVPAHRTLAAASYYQPRFAKTKAARAPRWPAFVLDRDRLAPYTDDAKQFDNRWLAKLPGKPDIDALAIRHVLYVVEVPAYLPELDDVNDSLVAYAGTPVDVRAVAASAFLRGPEVAQKPGGREFLYGGSAASDAGFFAHYPWKAPPLPPEPVATPEMTPRNYRPEPRSQKFAASGAPSVDPVSGRPKLGLVPVVVAAGTGILLGAKLSGRSGSWGRSGGFGFGGG